MEQKNIIDVKLDVLKLAHYPGRSPKENLEYAQAYFDWIMEAQQGQDKATSVPAKKVTK